MTNLVSILEKRHKTWVDKSFPGTYGRVKDIAHENIESNVAQWLKIATDIQKVDLEYDGEYGIGDVKTVLRFTNTTGETVRLFYINGELDDIVPY